MALHLGRMFLLSNLLLGFTLLARQDGQTYAHQDFEVGVSSKRYFSSITTDLVQKVQRGGYSDPDPPEQSEDIDLGSDWEFDDGEDPLADFINVEDSKELFDEELDTSESELDEPYIPEFNFIENDHDLIDEAWEDTHENQIMVTPEPSLPTKEKKKKTKSPGSMKSHHGKKRRSKKKKKKPKVATKGVFEKQSKESLVQKHIDRLAFKEKIIPMMKKAILVYLCYKIMLALWPALCRVSSTINFGELDNRQIQVLMILISVLFKMIETQMKKSQAASSKGKPASPTPKKQHFVFEPVNGRYEIDMKALQQAETQTSGKSKKSNKRKLNVQSIKSSKGESQSFLKSFNFVRTSKNTTENATETPPSTAGQERVFVLKWPDTQINLKTPAAMAEEAQVEFLRNSITFLIEAADSSRGDEVVLLLESPGGSAITYGLCASQLQRLRQKGLKLTICVDKVAASGGYLMACMGDRILAAPYAQVGSIGVMVPAIVNCQKALEKYGIDSYEFAAGVNKVPITPVGKVTPDKLEHMQEKLETVHRAFKSTVQKARPSVDVDVVGTGEVWLAIDALEYKLVDEILTSDEYLSQRSKATTVYQMKLFQQPLSGFMQKLFPPSYSQSFEAKVQSAVSSYLQRFAKLLVKETFARIASDVNEESELANHFYKTLFNFSFGK
mmetsp:Transcript_1957/g.2530  ORF Transcript_1957/g.2530 Transcript_1957/m.2530 type:complete len:671 (+) Transcript_1957:35-2047(+)